MREIYLKMLSELNDSLIEMGNLIVNAIQNAVKSLEKQDKQFCQMVFEAEKEINQKEKDIENLCLKLIVHQQPVANDLRFVLSILEMIRDMERIGDGATDIARIAMHLADKELIKELVIIPNMAIEAIVMVNLCIEAFIDKDLQLVNTVFKHDDIIDNQFEEVKNELALLISREIQNSTQAMDLLLVAKYFEKIGDHAVNVADWVGFAITGEHKMNY